MHSTRSANDKAHQLLGRWFSPGTPASSTTKIGRHNIAEILLKVALKHQISNQIKSLSHKRHQWCNSYVIVSNAVDRGFEPGSGERKDNNIGICWLSTKRESLTRKKKDWLAWIHNNVSKWGEISIRGLLLQWASAIKIQLNVLI